MVQMVSGMSRRLFIQLLIIIMTFCAVSQERPVITSGYSRFDRSGMVLSANCTSDPDELPIKFSFALDDIVVQRPGNELVLKNLNINLKPGGSLDEYQKVDTTLVSTKFHLMNGLTIQCITRIPRLSWEMNTINDKSKLNESSSEQALLDNTNPSYGNTTKESLVLIGLVMILSILLQR